MSYIGFNCGTLTQRLQEKGSKMIWSFLWSSLFYPAVNLISAPIYLPKGFKSDFASFC